MLAVAAFAQKTQAKAPFSLTLAAAHPQLRADQRSRTYVQLTLQGERPTTLQKVPLNLCVLLDTSASMGGRPIFHAKAALKAIVRRLRKEDRLSLVTFDGRAHLVLPPTDPRQAQKIRDAIHQISTGGSTALYAGLQMAAAQACSDARANRIILLSDGAANVGPMHPLDFKRLGRNLGQSGISVTTLGFGKSYDEDVLAQLAHQSDGNHAFIERPKDLAPLLERDFTHALTIVAADISAKVRFAPFVTPLRVLGPRAQIRGREVLLSFNSLYGGQQKRAIIEVQIHGHKAQERVMLAVAQATGYGKTEHKLRAQAFVSLLDPTTHTRARVCVVNKGVMEQVIIALTNSVAKIAVKLRDAGRTKEAQRACYANQKTIAGAVEMYGLDYKGRLRELWHENGEYARQMYDWTTLRKRMRQDQFNLDNN